MVCLSVQEFLESTTGNTKKTYTRGLKTFFSWYREKENLENLEQVLELRKEDLTQKPNENIVDYRFRAQRFEREIEKFFNHQIEKGHTANTAKTQLQGIKALFAYYAMPIKMRRGSKTNRAEKTERNFPLTIEHVRRMYAVANLRDKVILCMATDLGWRIGDFKNIQIKDLPDLSQEPPISFERKTQKCKTIACGFLSEETVKILKLYLKELEDSNTKSKIFLFPSKGNRHIDYYLSDEALSKILRKLTKQARIETNGKKVTFHCFRKMLLSAAINSGVGLVVGKKLVGKQIGFSDDTYLTDLALREKFTQLKHFLTINQQTKTETEQTGALKKAVAKLSEDLTTQRLVSDIVSQKNVKIEQELQEMKKQMHEMQRTLKYLRNVSESKRASDTTKGIVIKRVLKDGLTKTVDKRGTNSKFWKSEHAQKPKDSCRGNKDSL